MISKKKYEEARLLIDKYEKQETKKQQKSCDHDRTLQCYTGNQYDKFWYECSKCKLKLSEIWEETA